MTLQQYITKIDTLYKTGNAREHSYRGDLQNLIMAILPDVFVTNEPARVDCGAPNYVVTRKDVPIGYSDARLFSYVPSVVFNNINSNLPVLLSGERNKGHAWVADGTWYNILRSLDSNGNCATFEFRFTDELGLGNIRIYH